MTSLENSYIYKQHRQHVRVSRQKHIINILIVIRLYFPCLGIYVDINQIFTGFVYPKVTQSTRWAIRVSSHKLIITFVFTFQNAD